jgi:hypothetical protein
VGKLKNVVGRKTPIAGNSQIQMKKKITQNIHTGAEIVMSLGMMMFDDKIMLGIVGIIPL